MRRCPECRRDYSDDTLLYCLDDGSRLVEGPESVDEPATAILHSTPATSEAKTKPQIKRSVVSTAEIGFDKRLVLAPFLLALTIFLGFLGYRYFVPYGPNKIESIAVMPFVNDSGNVALAEPHAALGLVTWFFEWDRVTAEKEFKRAIQLNPNYPTVHHWYSRYLRGVGRIEEGFDAIKRAEELDPMSLIFINNVAESYIDQGKLDAAYRECQRIIELDPNFWAAYQTLVWIHAKQGRYQEALAAAVKGIQLSNRSNAALSQLAHVYGKLGRSDDARSIIKELEKKYAEETADGRDLAVAYVGLGDKDRAFEWLEKAFGYRSFHRDEPRTVVGAASW